MIIKIKNYYIFYRYFLYGSAILTGALISQFYLGYYGMFLASLYIAGALFTLTGLVVNLTIHKFPEDFKEELDELNDLDI